MLGSPLICQQLPKGPDMMVPVHSGWPVAGIDEITLSGSWTFDSVHCPRTKSAVPLNVHRNCSIATQMLPLAAGWNIT